MAWCTNWAVFPGLKWTPSLWASHSHSLAISLRVISVFRWASHSWDSGIHKKALSKREVWLCDKCTSRKHSYSFSQVVGIPLTGCQYIINHLQSVGDAISGSKTQPFLLFFIPGPWSTGWGLKVLSFKNWKLISTVWSAVPLTQGTPFTHTLISIYSAQWPYSICKCDLSRRAQRALPANVISHIFIYKVPVW